MFDMSISKVGTIEMSTLSTDSTLIEFIFKSYHEYSFHASGQKTGFVIFIIK